MSRQWPSGWEDPEDGELDAEELDAGTEVRLSEVAAFLATVPAPVLPGAIESRIVAALAAESAARAEDSPVPAPEPDAPRILRPAPAATRAQTRAQSRARARMHRRRRFSSAMVASPLLAVLLFAGLGYVISRGASSSSSSAPSAAAPASSAASGAAAPGYGADGSTAGAPERSPAFALARSGTKYLAATLVSQVRAELAAQHVTPAAVPSAAPTSAPAASASSAAASSSSGTSSVTGSAKASSISRGCVLHFTKSPRLIDLGTYQGTPAYVIADSTHVWVVGLGCTAQHQHLIASASLAG